ncbi:MAG TPA: thioredoxin domain-containing protein, partial [Gammaproteobacteria bacterium]|nr:thioredoxin domain-containing protein [Gammaproteobacteria bacterium]MCH78584.1 thioredoxin domain-containing protein [Gammaproteobacteria bacterium]
TLLSALEEQLSPPQTLVLRGDPQTLAHWQAAAHAAAKPGRLTFAIPAEADNLPGVLAHCAPRGPAVAYLCQGGSCGAPITDLDALTAA